MGTSQPRPHRRQSIFAIVPREHHRHPAGQIQAILNIMTNDKKTEKPKKLREEDIASPKGMRDILDKEYYAYQGFFEKASDIATYMDFVPLKPLYLNAKRYLHQA